MRCQQCGVENSDQAQSCSGCGSPLQVTQAMPSAAAKTSGLAIAAFVMGLLCLTCVGWPFLFLPAIICGIIALIMIANSQGRLKGMGFAITGLVLPIVLAPILMAILLPALNNVKILAQSVVCGTNLKGLGNAMMVYANDYDGQFPTPEKWCDLMMETVDVSGQSLICPTNMEEEFSYAVNENIAACHGNQTVNHFKGSGFTAT